MKAIKVIISLIFLAFGFAQLAVGAGIFFTAPENPETKPLLESIAFGVLAVVIAMTVFSNAFKGQG